MKEIVQQQHDFFRNGKTRDISFRKAQLRKLRSVLQNNEEHIFAALNADFKKPAFETYESELLMIYQEIDHLLSHVSEWAQPKKVGGSPINFPSRNYIYQQPYGVSLVIGAWNYPIQLTLNPALGSMAAGNCTILKPSEIATNSAKLLAEIINTNFEPGYLNVVEGNADTTQALLDESLDYIFFTGSTRVGKIIMKRAAEQLTPITLELGGKSPSIVEKSADLSIAAKRIVWGKFINSGQTCVSPDYVYIHQSQREEFCHMLKKWITSFYGDDASQSPDYARIINRQHFDRLTELINPQKVWYGGNSDRGDLYIEPTILTDIGWNDDIMQDEIFGPILPVLTYNDLDEVISAINNYQKPLALYLFSENDAIQQRIIREIPFGGGCINDTISHLINLELPFGGIGNSGLGSYHGKASFELFSHSQSIMKKSTWPDVPVRYPPYEGKIKWLRKLSKFI